MTRFATFFTVGAVLTSISTPSAHAQSPSGRELTVRVTEVKSDKGELVIALFAKSDGFPDNTSRAAHVVRVKPKEPTHTFKNLESEEYAVVVFHDLNGDGKVDKSVLGFPEEPIGLSNHASLGPKGGRPQFNKAKVRLTKPMDVKVNLIEIGR